ncbi:MAG TPA: PEP/pyruvate-binding domain-containing protein [Kofleriaceae bacterium]|nr:PEP/pyruvate-binding domain-containing protein [Kofleriaceae bacterium]
MRTPSFRPALVALAAPVALCALAALAGACGDDPVCDTSGVRKPGVNRLVCEAEFEAEAARPFDESVPGALTIKTLVDRADHFKPWMVDTEIYPLHRLFAVDQLGWPPGTPFLDEYFSPGRRFILGAITYYQEPDIWAYEPEPYDTADAEMTSKAFHALADATYFGDRLRFHPMSEEQEALARTIPDVPYILTDEIFAGITYQPLNLGETYARVHVLTEAQLEQTYVSPRELVVLDRVPNDLSVVAGVVTQELQTPLSHVNVLSQQRGTPNMGLKGALERFAALDGKWVHLTVGAFDWQVAEVTADEADAWWQAHRPPPTVVEPPDFSVTDVLDIDDVGLADIPRVGGKAAHYGVLRDLGASVHVADALAIPVARYHQFVVDNGFDVRIHAMLADADFRNDGNARKAQLARLQADMIAAPMSQELLAQVTAALERDFPGTRMKFRSSTTAEDLQNFTGAGLYTSAAGAVGDPERPIDVAIKTVWASIWNFRAFEERDYAGIDQEQVAMGILVTPAYIDELANGVAITANVFDPRPGAEDGFYINGQLGDVGVALPSPGVQADQLLYFFFHNGQPATYYVHSNLVAPGETVLSRSDLFMLGQALTGVRERFRRDYEPPPGYGFLPVDVEWKLVDSPQGHQIWIKQARPYPGRGTMEGP